MTACPSDPDPPISVAFAALIENRRTKCYPEAIMQREKISLDEEEDLGLPPTLDTADRTYRAARGPFGKLVYFIWFVPRDGTEDKIVPYGDIRPIHLAKSGRQLVIDYSDFAVVLEGRNLHYIAHRIQNGRCAVIEAFDEMRHDLPTDESQPFIERIRFVLPVEKKPKAKSTDRESDAKLATH